MAPTRTTGTFATRGVLPRQDAPTLGDVLDEASLVRLADGLAVAVARRVAEAFALPPEARGLLVALLQAPADRPLRRVLADWLEEHDA